MPPPEQQLQRFHLNLSEHKPLTLALTASLIAHFLLISKLMVTLPITDAQPVKLNVRLVNRQPSQLASASPKPQIKQTQKPHSKPQTYTPDNIHTVAIEPPLPASVEPETTTAALTPLIQPIAVVEAETTQLVPATPSIATAPTIASAPLNQTLMPPSFNHLGAPTPNTSNIPKPYAHIETDFEINRIYTDSNGDVHKEVIGSSKILFETQQETGTYALTNTVTVSNAGITEHKSTGVVMSNGLRPNNFTLKKGSDDESTQAASFAWSDGVIQLLGEKGITSSPLTVGTQDTLSYLYQFMYSPPTNSLLILPNGNQLQAYHLTILGEEIINTQFGETKTLHIIKTGGDASTTEFWLATEYRFIPVKILSSDKDGNKTEFTTTQVNTGIANNHNQ